MAIPWFDEFDDMTKEVTESEDHHFASNIQRWLDLLDSYPPFTRHFRDWELGAEFKEWLAEMEQGATSAVAGNNTLRWPRHKLERLGLQLVLFRAFGSGEVILPFFALKFVRLNARSDNFAEAMSKSIFLPFARELKRELQRLPDLNEEHIAPASDRVVSLDHNSHEYREIIGALDRIATAIERKNDYPDPNYKEQHLAEMAAGKILLKPPTVRAAAIWGVLGATLLWFMKTFAEQEIGHLADYILELLKTIIGS